MAPLSVTGRTQDATGTPCIYIQRFAYDRTQTLTSMPLVPFARGLDSQQASSGIDEPVLVLSPPEVWQHINLAHLLAFGSWFPAEARRLSSLSSSMSCSSHLSRSRLRLQESLVLENCV